MATVWIFWAMSLTSPNPDWKAQDSFETLKECKAHVAAFEARTNKKELRFMGACFPSNLDPREKKEGK